MPLGPAVGLRCLTCSQSSEVHAKVRSLLTRRRANRIRITAAIMDDIVNTEFGDQRYHRPMSENPPSRPVPAPGTSGFPAAPTGFPGAPTGTPPWPPAPPRPSRWLTFVALAIGLIATGLAIVGWFRPPLPAAPPHSGAPSYTEQQIADARTRACAAVDTTHKGVVLQSGAGAQDHVSSDPALAEAQAANARLSIIGGSWYYGINWIPPHHSHSPVLSSICRTLCSPWVRITWLVREMRILLNQPW